MHICEGGSARWVTSRLTGGLFCNLWSGCSTESGGPTFRTNFITTTFTTLVLDMKSSGPNCWPPPLLPPLFGGGLSLYVCTFLQFSLIHTTRTPEPGRAVMVLLFSGFLFSNSYYQQLNSCLFDERSPAEPQLRVENNDLELSHLSQKE